TLARSLGVAAASVLPLASARASTCATGAACGALAPASRGAAKAARIALKRIDFIRCSPWMGGNRARVHALTNGTPGATLTLEREGTGARGKIAAPPVPASRMSRLILGAMLLSVALPLTTQIA